MKRAAIHDVIQIPRGVWETAETKEDLEDWLLAHNPRIIRLLRRIRRHEDLAGRGKTLDELAGQAAPGISVRETTPAPLGGKPMAQMELAELEGLPDTRSQFERNIGKKFLVTAELDVPRGLDMSSVIEGARYLHRFGVDAINLTDGARARLRLSSVALSSMMQREVGIEAMTHMTTRDRNMIGLQAELLGAHALGLRNILCITGDPTSIGDYPHATSVFDVDSIGLIRAINAMNGGRDLMGNSLGQRTSFMIACAANPKADDMDRELKRLAKKIEAGADIVFTQPMYEMRTLEQFVKRTEQWKKPVMLGVLPLRSYRHAEFLHNEIPGMRIPESIREHLRNAGDKASVAGVQLTKDFLREARHLVSGVYLMPPFKKYDVVPQILEAIH